MWIFSRHGFYSAVYDKSSECVLVRARVKQHLVNLVKAFDIDCRVITTRNHDYRYRVWVEKNKWADVCKRLAQDIDYPNFKGECTAKFGRNDPYVHALHRVWAIGHALQPVDGPSFVDEDEKLVPKQSLKIERRRVALPKYDMDGTYLVEREPSEQEQSRREEKRQARNARRRFLRAQKRRMNK
jgi:hypothetical protein